MYTPSQNRALLAVIDRLIADGTRHVAKMRDLIAEGEQQQFDMTEAKCRLEQFLAAQAFRQAEREQVLKELDRTSTLSSHPGSPELM
jgi:hypothetical protein